MIRARGQWTEKRLGEILTLHNGKGLPQLSRRTGPYPVYGSSGIIGYHDEALVLGPGVIVGRKGSIGTVHFERCDFFPIDTVFYVELKDPEVDLKYLYYMLRQSNLSTLNTDAAVPGLNRHVAHRQIFLIPPPLTQQKIAAILSAYDALIENNLQRIQILEEMAQALYQEWFVKFRFPGHEKVRMVDSALGKIPEGWEIRTINGFVDVRPGFAFKSKTFVKAGRYGLVTIMNVKDGEFTSECGSRIDDLPPRMPKHSHLTTGDILLSLTGNIGRACLVYGSGYLLNQRVGKLVPTDSKSRAFVYFTFRHGEMRKRLEMISTGVAQQNLSPIQMGELEFAFPTPDLLEGFSDISEPIVDQILALNLMNVNLRRTRDLLLPRLISGELDASDLDVDIGEGTT